MKGALGLRKGSVPFKNDLETTLIVCILHVYILCIVHTVLSVLLLTVCV